MESDCGQQLLSYYQLNYAIMLIYVICQQSILISDKLYQLFINCQLSVAVEEIRIFNWSQIGPSHQIGDGDAAARRCRSEKFHWAENFREIPRKTLY